MLLSEYALNDMYNADETGLYYREFIWSVINRKGTIADSAESDIDEIDDAENLDDVTPSLKTEVIQALAVFRCYVQCEEEHFDLQYS